MSNCKTTPANWAIAREMFAQNHRLESISEVIGASISCISRKRRKENWPRIGCAAPGIPQIPPLVAVRSEPEVVAPVAEQPTEPTHQVKEVAKQADAAPRPVLVAPADRNEEVAKQVEALSSLGLIDEEIAGIVEVPLEVLRENYARELQTASPRLIAKVAQSLYRAATDSVRPSVPAAIYWLDRRGGPGWAEEGKQKVGKKVERQVAAEKAVAGKFAPAAAPKLVASGGKKV